MFLQFEPHHDSALSRFLLRRAAQQPLQIAHYLFWHMKAEMHNADMSERSVAFDVRFLHDFAACVQIF